MAASELVKNGHKFAGMGSAGAFVIEGRSWSVIQARKGGQASRVYLNHSTPVASYVPAPLLALYTGCDSATRVVKTCGDR